MPKIILNSIIVHHQHQRQSNQKLQLQAILEAQVQNFHQKIPKVYHQKVVLHQ